VQTEIIEFRNPKTRESHKKKVNYVADFETTTNPDDVRVWGWGLCAIPMDWQTLNLDNVGIGKSIEDFIAEIQELGNCNCYFHNLKFDGYFILYWLMTNGYEHVKGEGILLSGCFKTLINDMGQFYSISVRWENGFYTEFRDSLKKLPMSVKRIAQSFKMELGKGDIDYDAERPVGYDITPEEADYIRRDVLIVARALGQTLANGAQKLTVGSDALWEFKKLTGKDIFDRLFPILPLNIDAEIRRAYRGGFTYADSRFRGKLNGCGLVLDVNSLYPSIMYTKPLPYGLPQYVDGYIEPTETHPLILQTLTFTAKLKPGHIPCIQIKGNSIFSATEYLTEINDPTTLTVTNVDLELYNDHYDMNIIEYVDGWRFRAATGIFDTYIEKWSRIKANSEGGIREIAKLHLNSLYGKFATNPIISSKYPTLENGAVKLIRGADEERNPVYTAAGVFITSFARELTIRAAQANYNAFAYADTDSLHLLGLEQPPTSLNIHPSELGAWKLEYHFERAYYIRAKAYLEQKTDGEYVNRIAGLPEHLSSELTFADLVPGKVIHGKLTPKSVPGGVVLRDTPYELKL